MKKNAFTLIELLAVIVILAIIALIATPIVLNIINDTKESSLLRSAEFYLDAVENEMVNGMIDGISITDGIYTIMDNGNLCLELDEKKECKNNFLTVDINGGVPNKGYVGIEKGKINEVLLVLNEKTISQNINGELKYLENIPLCTLIKGRAKQIGAKYECEVKPGTKYNFYVLSYESDGTTNLILDKNVYYNVSKNITGLTDKNNIGLVAWYNPSMLNIYGPVTAMEYLYNSTKSWTNIPPLNYEYMDKEFQGTVSNNASYISFISKNGIASITQLSGNIEIIGTEEEPLRSRLPIYSSDITKTEILTFNGDNLYLYEYLDGEDWGFGETITPQNNIPKIKGYWTLSTGNSYNRDVWIVSSDGSVKCDGAGYGGKNGVRPVINLKL